MVQAPQACPANSAAGFHSESAELEAGLEGGGGDAGRLVMECSGTGVRGCGRIH